MSEKTEIDEMKTYCFDFERREAEAVTCFGK
jgi:hypothetical protein